MPTNSLAGATQDEVRRHNLGMLLRLLHSGGAMSRSELTARTGLNRSTVGALTAELVEAGLAREDAPVGRGVGRPSIVVAPEPTAAYVIVVDIGVEHVSVALVGLGGSVLARRDVLHQLEESPRLVCRHVGRMAQSLAGDLPPSATCVGVGVGVPGVVRHADGLVEVAPNLRWSEVPLGQMVAETLGSQHPVRVANDADLAAMAEHARGAARGVDYAVLITGDVGVGAGIIVDGRLMSGAGGYGGEFGHMVVDPDGQPCGCGGRGCWETTIGVSAVLRALGADDGVAWRDAVRDTPEVRRSLRPVGRWMGRGVRTILNVLNPQVVVFGGMYGRTYPLVADVVAAEIEAGLAAPLAQVEFRTAELGADSVLVGASEQAFEALMADPVGHLVRSRGERVA